MVGVQVNPIIIDINNNNNNNNYNDNNNNCLLLLLLRIICDDDYLYKCHFLNGHQSNLLFISNI